MYLIADSGATKTEWSLFSEEGEIKRFRGLGLNPNAIPAPEIQAELRRLQQEFLSEYRVSQVWFYGSGLRGSFQQHQLEQLLRGAFPATQCSIDTDLVAAIRCTGRKRGIVCILGTGSNACLFEGTSVLRQAGGDGYLFGDEGSGADLGKHLLQAFLRDNLPGDLLKELEKAEGRDLQAIKMAAYRASRPSAYLAQFARYVAQFQQHPAVYQMMLDRFQLFLTLTVQRFPEAKQLDIDLIGSVGYHFYPIISEAAASLGLKLGKRWQSPLDGLLEHHISSFSS